MTKKWSNLNLPGALHFVTCNVLHRIPVFTAEQCCEAFLEVCAELLRDWPSKLISFVLMPDHFHLIVNLVDGRIRSWIQELKSLTAQRLVEINPPGLFRISEEENQVWQESFNTFRLWSGWMIWQKINYIHNNPLKAGLVDSASDYRWSSFRSFYGWESEELLSVDHEWWYEGDMEKQKEAQRRGDLS